MIPETHHAGTMTEHEEERKRYTRVQTAKPSNHRKVIDDVSILQFNYS